MFLAHPQDFSLDCLTRLQCDVSIGAFLSICVYATLNLCIKNAENVKRKSCNVAEKVSTLEGKGGQVDVLIER